ncbi:DeoR/GlpR family DNA-binding transcription regulator [Ornithinibacillus halotolerans]|uniref:DeoR family transcriptional regulator n=1 Tax=Ornithinibacillus halotolerans TaxID=1274357 RepID=A0A916W8Z6_9BACI|nr:DeoR/GlpR family DNA-binding transcription regulator [Ornithinibacillus halotolerans]GGA77133.1 DeoR family transcriptional regulator [Ornithinibacillus halotolerans]
MLAEERRQQVMEIIQKEGRVIAKDLSDMFNISIDSVRRDLTIMEKQGLLQKTYGGAVAITPHQKVRTLPSPESKRYSPPARHQDEISKYAASFIKEQDTVFIGSAGIQYGMIKHLPTSYPFTLVTNSLKIAEAVRNIENITSYLIGGKLRANSANSMIDIIALEMVGRFTFDIGFLTGGGITADGISTATPEAAAFHRRVSEVSRKTICLAPHEKVSQQMFISSVPMDRIDVIITDKQATEKELKEMEKKNVEVIFVEA